MRGAVFMPNIPILIRELRLLERRVGRSGKDSVDHGASGSDDHANVLAGLIWLLRDGARKQNIPIVGPDTFALAPSHWETAFGVSPGVPPGGWRRT
jgi:hypothetical protein